ncbi:hypothetical protein W911_08335 [Hyphomicrobium nitrativorans NL23]|uniref:Inverse autotransporter beta-domain domain-containing protein n=1 Tax=Hyphomicrobium nitrativorans NL23 TaxID=1029756 RepID=V5SJH8_9HYPH|nr:inverse autotransporter beta-barrel domain-containing protein [Hyphomicrobium nitrativorans]AHB50114.1 hypothetical protein W911_08335 [Hyphomicrobium nitrativorans NL23]
MPIIPAKRVGRAAAAVVAATLTLTPAAAQDLSDPKWTPWLELGGFYGSNDTSRGEAVLWVPLAQSHNSVLFGEARGKLFEDDMREGNFAFGYRQMQANGWNVGFWGGYDIRESQFGNAFHQLAGGIEALSDRWDVRANAYLPLNDSETLSSFTSLASFHAVEINGPNIGLVTTTTVTNTVIDELALRGFDAEIGAKIFSTPLDLSGPSHELRLYAGAFHFDHADLPNSVTGPRVRAEWRMDDIIDQWAGSRLTLEAEYSHDQLRDDRVEVGARLRLPFGDSGTRVASRSLTAQERRMSEGLERDTDIVTNTATTQTTTAGTATEAVEDAKTGVRFDRVATVDGTGDLTTTSSAAGGNSLIIADGSAGDIVGAQTLQGDQTLQGGGATIQVRGVTSGIVVDFTAPGARPTLARGARDEILRISASNTHIAGVDLVGDGTVVPFSNNDGIYIHSGATNVKIDAVTITNAGEHGIYLTRHASADISNSLITQTGRQAVYGVGNNTFTVSNTNIVDASGGIRIGEQSDVTVSDVELRNAPWDGLTIFRESTVRVSRMSFENGGHGIFIDDQGVDFSLTDSALRGTFTFAGIRNMGTNVTFSGTGNTVDAGATFGLGFCHLVVPVTGTVVFDTGNCP